MLLIPEIVTIKSKDPTKSEISITNNNKETLKNNFLEEKIEAKN
jgi:hypothetical protein